MRTCVRVFNYQSIHTYTHGYPLMIYSSSTSSFPFPFSSSFFFPLPFPFPPIPPLSLAPLTLPFLLVLSFPIHLLTPTLPSLTLLFLLLLLLCHPAYSSFSHSYLHSSPPCIEYRSDSRIHFGLLNTCLHLGRDSGGSTSLVPLKQTRHTVE